jgi:hypothetical protein
MKTSKPKSLEQSMAEREDDAAELAKHQPVQTDLSSRIAAYLSDQLSAAEMDALCRTNQKDIDAELDRRNRVAAEKRAREGRKAQLLWIDDIASKADADAADAEIRKFILAHPDFPRHIPENGNRLLRWLADERLLCTLENLERGYAVLRPQGVFIQATEEEHRIRKLSAEEFKAEHITDWPEEQGIPPLVLEGIARSLDTFVAGRPEYVRSDANKDKIMAALKNRGPLSVQNIEEVYQDLVARGELELNKASRGEVLRYVDMGGHAPGYPARPQKYSFRKKLDEMTADEVKQRILNDPNFETALNNLSK